MSMTTGSAGGAKAEINVTPLIDVLLVMLIIFMVIQPVSVRGLDTALPQPSKMDNSQPRTPLVVEVIDGGERGVQYRINQVPSGETELGSTLAGIFAARSDKAMFIRGDAGLEFSAVARAIDDGRKAGAETIAILTPRSGLR